MNRKGLIWRKCLPEPYGLHLPWYLGFYRHDFETNSRLYSLIGLNWILVRARDIYLFLRWPDPTEWELRELYKINKDTKYVEISRELFDELSHEWSVPVRIKIAHVEGNNAKLVLSSFYLDSFNQVKKDE